MEWMLVLGFVGLFVFAVDGRPLAGIAADVSLRGCAKTLVLLLILITLLALAAIR